MPDAPLVQPRPDLVEGVVILDVLPREITEPDVATRLGVALRSVLESGVSRLILIDMAASKYLSSTAFAVLLSFGRRVGEAGGKVAICRMDPFVRAGADIIKLGRLVPIHDDEPAAIAALIA